MIHDFIKTDIKNQAGGASSLEKYLILLSKYSVARSFYCSKYKKYTSEPDFKLSFHKLSITV